MQKVSLDIFVGLNVPGSKMLSMWCLSTKTLLLLLRRERERPYISPLLFYTENAEEDSLQISQARTWNHGLLSLTALQNLAQLSIRKMNAKALRE